MESAGRCKAVNILWHVGCVALALIFIYAGILKLRDPYQFAVSVEHYRIIGSRLSAILAFTLPWAEILCGLALLTRQWREGAFLILSLLLLLFVLALSAALIRRLDISCGCLGSANSSPAWVALLRALVLLGITIGLICTRRSTEGSGREASSASG